MKRRQFFTAVAATGAAVAVGNAAFAGGETVYSGTFEGRSNHVTSGTARVILEDGRYFVELGDDFSLDGGPDPRVAFGKGGEYDPNGYLGALLELTGKQRYAVPSVWDPAQFTDIVIWCDVASVPLGIAALK